MTLADASGDRNPHRADETYRRALIGVYARLAGTLKALTGGEALRHAVGSGKPYGEPAEFRRDLVRRARFPARPSRRRSGARPADGR